MGNEYLNKLLDSIIDIINNIDKLEPNLSFFLSKVERVINDNEDNSQLLRNPDLCADILNRDTLLILSSLYNSKTLECCKPGSSNANACKLFDNMNIFRGYADKLQKCGLNSSSNEISNGLKSDYIKLQNTLNEFKTTYTAKPVVETAPELVEESDPLDNIEFDLEEEKEENSGTEDPFAELENLEIDLDELMGSGNSGSEPVDNPGSQEILEVQEIIDPDEDEDDIEIDLEEDSGEPEGYTDAVNAGVNDLAEKVEDKELDEDEDDIEIDLEEDSGEPEVHSTNPELISAGEIEDDIEIDLGEGSEDVSKPDITNENQISIDNTGSADTQDEEDEISKLVKEAVDKIQNDPDLQSKIDKLSELLDAIPVPACPDVKPSDMSATDYNALKAKYKKACADREDIQLQITKLVNQRDQKLRNIEDSVIRQYNEQQKRESAQRINKLKFPNIAEEYQDEVKDLVRVTVNDIIAVYDDLYAELYQDIPLGILTPLGIASINSDFHTKYTNTIAGKTLYTLINELCGNGWRANAESQDLINPSWIVQHGANFALNYNYAFRLHIRNLFGIYEGKNGLNRDTVWSNYKAKILKVLEGIITDIISKMDLNDIGIIGSLKSIITQLFTNVIIIKSFSYEGILSIRVRGISPNTNFGRVYSDPKMTGICISRLEERLGITGIDNVGVNVIGNEVYDITIALNKKKYTSEILFSYKILDGLISSGNTVNYKNTILGKTLSYQNVTYNFSAPGAIDTLILAGSRSGKGVLTLNILATLIGSGCPVCYFDFKPDMSTMLWDLEKKLIANGYPDTKILAVDSAAGKNEDHQPTRGGTIYFSNKNTKQEIKELNNLLLIPWIKGLTLMAIVAYCRQNKKAGLNSKGKKAMFIWDEAQNFNKALSTLSMSLQTIKEENKPTSVTNPETKQKEKVYSDIYIYADKLKKVIDNLFLALSDFRNTSAGSGNAGMIMLGQQADASAWAQGALKRDALGFMVGNCSCKILGREAVGETKYELGSIKTSGKDKLEGIEYVTGGNMGYFVKIEGSLGTNSNAKVFKSSLVLNENDYDLSTNTPGKFTGAMLDNITDPVVANDVINNDFCNKSTGELRKEIGFAGVVEYVSKNVPNFNISEALSAGYKQLESVLLAVGILGDGNPFGYKYVEDYLFDASIESLVSFDTFKNMFVNDKIITDIISTENLDGTTSEDSENGENGENGESSNSYTWAQSDEKQSSQPSQSEENTIDIDGENNIEINLGADDENSKKLNNLRDLVDRLGINLDEEDIEDGDDLLADNVKVAEDSKALNDAISKSAEARVASSEANIDLLKARINEAKSAKIFAEASGDSEAAEAAQQNLEEAEQQLEQAEITRSAAMENAAKAAEAATRANEAVEELKKLQQMRADEAERRDIENRAAKAQADQVVSQMANMFGMDRNEFIGAARNLFSQVSSSPEFANPNPMPSYVIEHGEIKISNVGNTQKIGLNNENATIIDRFKLSKFGKLHPKALSTEKGALAELKNRWKIILDIVASEQGSGGVTKVILKEDMLKFQNKVIHQSGILNGEDGITLSDMCDLKMLAERFPLIREMEIGQDVILATRRGNKNYITDVFRTFKKLQLLTIVTPFGSRKFTRDTLQQQEVIEQLRNDAARADLKDAIDVISLLNCRKKKENGVTMSRISNKIASTRGRLAETAQANLQDRSVSGAVRGTLAAGGILLGTLAAAPFRLAGRFLSGIVRVTK